MTLREITASVAESVRQLVHLTRGIPLAALTNEIARLKVSVELLSERIG